MAYHSRNNRHLVIITCVLWFLCWTWTLYWYVHNHTQMNFFLLSQMSDRQCQQASRHGSGHQEEPMAGKEAKLISGNSCHWRSCIKTTTTTRMEHPKIYHTPKWSYKGETPPFFLKDAIKFSSLLQMCMRKSTSGCMGHPQSEDSRDLTASTKPGSPVRLDPCVSAFSNGANRLLLV